MLDVAQGPLDPEITQNRLNQLYERWRVELFNNEAWFEGAVPPHLLKVTDDYCRAPLRILFYGQETEGWGSSGDGQSFDCFVGGDCSIEHLVGEYGRFNFATDNPRRNSPLWRAFRFFQDLEGSSVLWANLCRAAFETPRSHSFLRAPAERRARFVAQQTNLMREEIDILQPHAALFAIGPHYDHILEEVFDVERFEAVTSDLTIRQLGRVVSRFLPAASFRTYHPGFLNREYKVRWRWLEEARTQIRQDYPISTASTASIGD